MTNTFVALISAVAVWFVGSSVRTWWLNHRNKTTGKDPALCEVCKSPEIALICDDMRAATVPEMLWHPAQVARVIRWGAPRVFELTAWCADHAPTAADRRTLSTIYYWTPGPVALTWRDAEDYIRTDQPGCCHCGGKHGPTRFAVWGLDAPDATWSEGYCARCMATPTTWVEGCSYADLGALYSITDYDRAVETAWWVRIPIPASLVVAR